MTDPNDDLLRDPEWDIIATTDDDNAAATRRREMTRPGRRPVGDV